MYDKRRDHQDVYRVPLLRHAELPTWYFDQECVTAARPIPHIDLQLGPSHEDGLRVKKIEIVLCYRGFTGDIQPLDPLTLLLEPFDFGYGPDNLLKGPNDSGLRITRDSARQRSKYRQDDDSIDLLHFGNSFSLFAGRVWDEYCLFEGSSTIWRTDFCGWIYRFTALTSDMIDYPFVDELNWDRRRRELQHLLQKREACEINAFHEPHWSSFIEGDQWPPNLAERARQRDACVTIDDFRAKVK